VAKNSSFYLNVVTPVQVKEVKPSVVHDVSWQFELGMHNFRFFERETLRVLKRKVLRRDVKGGKTPVTKCENRSTGRRGRSSEGGIRPGVNSLPLSVPKRSAAGRRERIKSRVRSVPEKVLNAKNPVKVTDVPSEDTWHHREVNARTGRWIYCTEHYCVGPCKADKTIYGRCPVTKTPLNRCKDQTRIRSKYLKRKKAYVRRGANRGEKRKNWFNDKVMRTIPGKLLKELGKSKVSKTKHNWMTSRIKTPPNVLKRMLEEQGGKPKVPSLKFRREINVLNGMSLLWVVQPDGSQIEKRCISVSTPRSRSHKLCFLKIAL